MDEIYICPSCGIQYTLDDLEDNDDGTCPECGCPLESSCNDAYSNMKSLQPEEYDKELSRMIQDLKVRNAEDVWHNIEVLTNAKTRAKRREQFFKALKILNKKFELWEK
jgi:predicted amidophosphoribosyltransferase